MNRRAFKSCIGTIYAWQEGAGLFKTSYDGGWRGEGWDYVGPYWEMASFDAEDGDVELFGKELSEAFHSLSNTKLGLAL